MSRESAQVSCKENILDHQRPFRPVFILRIRQLMVSRQVAQGYQTLLKRVAANGALKARQPELADERAGLEQKGRSVRLERVRRVLSADYGKDLEPRFATPWGT